MGDRLGTLARWRPYLVAVAALLVTAVVPTVHRSTHGEPRVTTAPTTPDVVGVLNYFGTSRARGVRLAWRCVIARHTRC